MKRPTAALPYGLWAGFGLGLLVGAGMLVGAMATRWSNPPATTAVRTGDATGTLHWPGGEVPLHASATDSGETFAMATGLIAEGVEGVFFMDFLTGDLTCWVINRRTGGPGGIFKYNVINDLGIDPARKKPRYLMVTGLAQLQRGSASFRYGECIVYVADANTGAFAAYTVPWNRNAYAAGGSQVAPLILLGKSSIRGNLESR